MSKSCPLEILMRIVELNRGSRYLRRWSRRDQPGPMPPLLEPPELPPEDDPPLVSGTTGATPPPVDGAGAVVGGV